jgi:hypothetical protein
LNSLQIDEIRVYRVFRSKAHQMYNETRARRWCSVRAQLRSVPSKKISITAIGAEDVVEPGEKKGAEEIMQ